MPWDRTARQLHDRANDRRQSDPTDGGRAIVGPMPARRGKTGRSRGTGLRVVFDGGRHILAAGCRRRSSASGYPPFSTVRNRFRAWRGGGLPKHVPNRLRDLARQCAGRYPMPTGASIDSRSAKAAESGGPGGHHAGKKGRGRRRRIAVDAEGTPTVTIVHSAGI